MEMFMKSQGMLPTIENQKNTDLVKIWMELIWDDS